MNILMIGPYKPQVGGPAIVNQELVNIFKQKNRIFVINTDVIGHPIGLRHWKDGEVDVYQERIYSLKRYRMIQTLFQTTKRALLLRKKVDIYHSHGTSFSGIGFIDKTKPLVLSIHGYRTLELELKGRIKPNSPKFKFMRRMEKKFIERADAVIAVGKKLEEWIIETLGAESEKVFYIPNGVDLNKFNNLPLDEKHVNTLKKKYDLTGKKIILFTKHFTQRYGAQYLIPAFAIVQKNYPDTVLVMTNEDSDLKKMIELSKKEKVYDNIRFTGRLPIDTLIGLYKISDMFVHPSINDQETFGISLIEAMACEKPVISTAVGGPKEILEDGKRQMGTDVGILIPPKNIEAIANAIVNFLEHPYIAKKIRKISRKYVEHNYTWTKSADQVMEVYKFAIRNSKKKN